MNTDTIGIQLPLEQIINLAEKDKIFWDKKEWSPTNAVYYKFVFDKEIGKQIIKDLTDIFRNAPNYYRAFGRSQQPKRYDYTEFGYSPALRKFVGRSLGIRDLETFDIFAKAYLVDFTSEESVRERNGVSERPRQSQYILVIENPNTKLTRLQSHFLSLMNAFYDTAVFNIPKTPLETSPTH